MKIGILLHIFRQKFKNFFEGRCSFLRTTVTAKILVPSGGRMVIIRLDRQSEEYRKFWEDVEKEERYEEHRKWVEAKERRLISSHSPKKVKVILAFEEVFEEYDCNGDFYRFYLRLKPCVDFWVRYYVFNWSRWRLSYPDFESVFWEEAWKVANDYNFWDSDFYLYETLELCFKRRGNDITRKASETKQGRFEHGAERFPEGFENRYPGRENTEKAVINQILVTQMINDPSLTGEEQEFLRILSENPDAKDDEMAEIMGLGYRQKAWRLRKSIRKKLEKYREYALAYDADAYKWQPQFKKKFVYVSSEADTTTEEDGYTKVSVNSKRDGESIPLITIPAKAQNQQRRKVVLNRLVWFTENLKFPLRMVSTQKARKDAVNKKKKKKKKRKVLFDDKGRFGGSKIEQLPPDFDPTSVF